MFKFQIDISTQKKVTAILKSANEIYAQPVVFFFLVAHRFGKWEVGSEQHAPPYLRHHICATIFASPYSRHHIRVTIFASPYLRHHIRVTIFASPYSRHHICATIFASPYLRHHMCAIRHLIYTAIFCTIHFIIGSHIFASPYLNH